MNRKEWRLGGNESRLRARSYYCSIEYGVIGWHTGVWVEGKVRNSTAVLELDTKLSTEIHIRKYILDLTELRLCRWGPPVITPMKVHELKLIKNDRFCILKSLLWGWCGGQHELIRSVSLPYEHWFKSQLLRFLLSPLLMQWEEQ